MLTRNPTANIGLHNDCFMTSTSDSGTYSNLEYEPLLINGQAVKFPVQEAGTGPKTAKEWALDRIAKDGFSFGGETCPLTLDPDNPKYRTERWRVCSNMLTEPAAFQMSYLYGDWAPKAVEDWTDGGCYPTIRSRLGYRFHVTRVAYTPTVPAGGKFSVAIDVTNNGWARLPEGPERSTCPPKRHHRAQLPAGRRNHPEFGGPAPTPRSPPPPRHRPPAPTVSGSPLLTHTPPKHIPYAIRLATLRGGTNTFDTATGENNLGINITI